MSEWEPGDVAIGVSKYVKGRLLIRAYDETWMDLDGERYDGIHDVRPLVVIDPGDGVQIERLTRAYLDASTGLSGTAGDAIQAALREFAAPTSPRIDEPTGLGAVVETEDGVLWLRTVSHTDDDAVLGKPWTHGPVRRNWQIVAPVRVLSEGVTT